MTQHLDDWDKHWGEYADAAEENPAQAYRRRLIISLLGISGDGSGARILDVGSGQGDFAAEVLKHFPKAQIVGLELSQAGIDIAARKVPAARFFQRDLPCPAQVPDELCSWATHASCSEVPEHLDRPVEFLSNVQEYLAPNCRLVVTVPGGPMSAFDKHIGHRQHYSPERLGDLLRRAGFRLERLIGAGFPFFNLYRMVVILRKKRLVRDVAARPGGRYSTLASLVMRMFGILFHCNVAGSPWGWQTVAVARRPP